ncbi:phosphate acetyltransferase [bacterium SCSIO 12643]|nr:phosphate acetyltransferase [bacterium SCSIO 12643]
MARSLYISSSEPYSGKTLIALGCFEVALRHTKKVALFRPIIRDTQVGCKDHNIELILNHHNLDQPYESTYAMERTEALNLLAHNKFDQFIEQVINKYKQLEEAYDFVICEGTDYIGDGSEFELDLNALIAKNLDLPVLVLGQGLGRDIDDILTPIQWAIQSYQDHNCKILGTIINKVQPERRTELLSKLRKELPEHAGELSAIPTNKILSSPSVREIAEQLNAKVLFGHEHLDNLVYDFQTVAMRLNNYFKLMTEKSLAITPGDRTDILVGAMQASMSNKRPNVSGIVLTGGMLPSDETLEVIDGLPQKIPVLSVDSFTFETSVKAEQVKSSIHQKDTQKIALSLDLFDKYVEASKFFKKLAGLKSKGMTPKMFLYHLRKIAGNNRRKIVLPEGNDIRILQAIEILQSQNLVDLVLLGDEAMVKSLAHQNNISIDYEQLEIINPQTSPLRAKYAQEYFNLRQHKGVNMDMAMDALTDVSYFGTMMVHHGDAHGMVSGAAHTTQHTIRPALQIIKTSEGSQTVSSVFFMLLEDRVVAYGDCAINPDPNAQQLAEIAISSADTSKRFGIEPKVAMLSYSSGSSGKGADVEKVREATEIVKKLRPDILVEGPIQYDAAVDLAVGQKKLPNSPVAGQATVLVFPDLNTGNNTYKAVQRETGALAVGPVLQGLKKPVNDLSRGCLVDDIVNTVTITAIQSVN